MLTASNEAVKWRAQRGNSSVVEHDLAKVGVEGSNPFSRSSFKRSPVMRGFVVSVRCETSSGRVAEWLCSGLQIRVRRFNSDLGLQTRNPAPAGFFVFRNPEFCKAMEVGARVVVRGGAGDNRRHGRRRLAYMDVLAACPRHRRALRTGQPSHRVSFRASLGGETGRRIGLKIRRPQGHEGSSPSPGTIDGSEVPCPATPPISPASR